MCQSAGQDNSNMVCDNYVPGYNVSKYSIVEASYVCGGKGNCTKLENSKC